MEKPRKMIDCRWFPTKNNCSVCITGTEEEVLQIAVDHAEKRHGHKNTPALREELRKLLRNEDENNS